jgi:hypothetical protein
MSSIIEEANKFKAKEFAKNYFLFDQFDKLSSFLITKNKLWLLTNFEPDEGYLISKFKTVALSNLFVFNISNPTHFERIRVSTEYVFEIKKLKNFSVIIGIDFQPNRMTYHIYDESLILRYNFSDPITYNINLSSVITSNFYNIAILNDRLSSFKYSGQVFEMKIMPEGLVTQDSELKSGNKDKGLIKCISYDEFKYLLSYEENVVEIYSSKTRELIYVIVGGSTLVVPKSYVVNPYYKGFSKIMTTKSSVICVMGNLIREYSFINK